MQLDEASYYALCATIWIAQSEAQRPVQGRMVARECELPFEYLLKILQQLARSGILASQRGRTGGFALARPPEQITVLEIVEAIQGPIRGRTEGPPNACLIRPQQRIENLCAEIAEHARQRLSQVTIADLIRSG